MTAPTLVLVGHGGRDPRITTISADIRAAILAIRPQLDVHAAFLGGHRPSAVASLAPLVRRGVSEIVLVPLVVSDAFATQDDVAALVAEIRTVHPGLGVAAARPIGPEAQLLSVIDRRLRDALRARRAAELDGLVFSAAGSGDVRSNALVARRARQWATHHRLPHLTAFATGSGPSAAEAVRTLRAQGRRHIAVGSWFLAPGEIFERQAQQALDAGAVAVSGPLGAGPEIAETALTRYVVAAMELVDLEVADGGPADTVEAAPVRHLSIVSA